MNTKNKYKKKNKKTKRKRGGKPLFINTHGYYNNGKLVDYRFLRNQFDKDQQKKYAKKHMVYYSTEPASLSDNLNNLFNISEEQKQTINNFLIPDPDMKFTDTVGDEYYRDSESIVVHDRDDIKKIKITNKLIETLNKTQFASLKTTNDCQANLPQCVKTYHNFIDNNKPLLTSNLDPMEKQIAENELFVSPVFFYIIGKKIGFSNCEIDDLDLELVKNELNKTIKNLLDQRLTGAPQVTKKPLTPMATSALDAIATLKVK